MLVEGEVATSVPTAEVVGMGVTEATALTPSTQAFVAWVAVSGNTVLVLEEGGVVGFGRTLGGFTTILRRQTSLHYTSLLCRQRLREVSNLQQSKAIIHLSPLHLTRSRGQRHNLARQQRQGIRKEQLMPLSRQAQMIFQMIQQSHPKKEETKRARVNLTAIGATLKCIHFLFALLYFAVSFALAIMSKKYAQI